ncbi:MAG: hypothetical protein E7671_02420 [Ruminococcaceae bacterium]|nr:hypothetical protein [Oscillospiraceae bacterium]
MLSFLAVNTRRLACLLAFLLVLLLFSSCSAVSDVSSEHVLAAMISSAKDLPAGKIYTTASSPGAPDYLSQDLLTALYGSGDYPSVFERTREISIWTSSGLYAVEFAVFFCNTDRDTEEIADLCLGRIDDMRRFVNENSDKLSLEQSVIKGLDGAKVIIAKRCVIMAVHSSASIAIDAAKEEILRKF